MAQLRFKSFMCCSFGEEDRQIVDFFSSYCDSFGFDIFKYDYQEPRSLSDAIKGHIKECDCVIAIATRRGRLESGDWVCPDWVQHEVVYANAVGKPVAVFAEDGVSIGGMIEKEMRFQRFSREPQKLLSITPLLNKSLMAMYQLLEQHFKKGVDASPDIYLHSVSSQDELSAENVWTTTCQIELESLVDGLKGTQEGLGDADWLRPPFEAIEDIEFSSVQAPAGVRLFFRRAPGLEDPNMWDVVFDPPLRTGQRVSYAYRFHAKSIRPFTREEAHRKMETGEHSPVTSDCASNWDLLFPTGFLTFTILFPSNYPISNPGYAVETLDSFRPVMDEITKIREAEGFQIRKFFDRYSLSLSVMRPLKGCRYEIRWQPPSEADLLVPKSSELR